MRTNYTCLLSLLAVAFLAACSPKPTASQAEAQKADRADGYPLQKGTVVLPVGAEVAAERLATPDAFSERWSAFDIPAIAADTSVSDKAGTFAFLREQGQDWSEAEKQALQAAVKTVAEQLAEADLAVPLPEVIEVIKTDMKEAGGAAGYTRGAYIVLNAGFLTGEEEKRAALESLFAHELFHVVSRHNPDLRDALYALIGFEKCEEIPYPEPIAHLRISNPDAPVNEHCVTVRHEGVEKKAVMALLARGPYQGGSFFNYLTQGLMVVEGEGERLSAKLKEGPEGPEPEILPYNATNIVDLIGQNTGYNIHPEEVTAEHFVMALQGKTGLPDQQLVNELKAAMQGYRP